VALALGVYAEAQEEQLCLLAFEQRDATLKELTELAARRMKVDRSIIMPS
jgi:hypothetical protein